MLDKKLHELRHVKDFEIYIDKNHYILLLIYVIVTILICFMIFVGCMTYIHYIYVNKYRERILKKEIQKKLLKFN